MLKNARNAGVVFAALVLLSASHAECADARADFLKLIDRPRVPLAAKVNNPTTKDDLEEYRFSFAAEANQRVPGLLVKQATATPALPAGTASQPEGSAAKSEADATQVKATPPLRKPVVIALHGTGGTKAGERSLLNALAKRGFIAVSIDGRYHGERSRAGKGSEEYQSAILRAWRTHTATDKSGEHPFYFDTVWDVMRLIDYLETRDDVDPKRIGVFGTSKGGIETYLAAAVDPRIAVAVPAIGLQSFHWALENDKWQPRVGTIKNAFEGAAKEAGEAKPDAKFVHDFYDRVVPGIDGEFDGPAMVPFIAPRPLLVINGDSDDRTPLPGLKLCTDAAQTAYHAANADDHFVVRIQEKTGHKVNPDSRAAAIDWFAKWLQP